MPARDITLNVRLIVRESTTETVKEHR
jgi:hypothetical protein